MQFSDREKFQFPLQANESLLFILALPTLEQTVKNYDPVLVLTCCPSSFLQFILATKRSLLARMKVFAVKKMQIWLYVNVPTIGLEILVRQKVNNLMIAKIFQE
jgi:hypothetical protein